jgi:hypothetical protein
MCTLYNDQQMFLFRGKILHDIQKPVLWSSNVFNFFRVQNDDCGRERTDGSSSLKLNDINGQRSNSETHEKEQLVA